MSNFTKLATNRNMTTFMIRGVCSFAILAILDMYQMQRDLNTIVAPYTTKRATFLFFGKNSGKLMNEELKRRGIDLEVNTFLPSYSKYLTALNLLSEDYNKNGK